MDSCAPPPPHEVRRRCRHAPFKDVVAQNHAYQVVLLKQAERYPNATTEEGIWRGCAVSYYGSYVNLGVATGPDARSALRIHAGWTSSLRARIRLDQPCAFLNSGTSRKR